MEEEQDNSESENQDAGGETSEKQTTETDPKDYKKIAEDQKRRAEKAETDLKAEREVKAKQDADKKEIQSKINPAAQDPIEVAKMAAALTGLSDKELTELTAVARMRNVSFAEAKSDPLFQAWQKSYLEAQKKQDAKMGASNSSGQTEPEEGVTSGMKREDHMELWEKVVGKK